MVQNRLSEAAKRRLNAGQILQKGKGCAEVTLAGGVARQTVYTGKVLLEFEVNVLAEQGVKYKSMV